MKFALVRSYIVERNHSLISCLVGERHMPLRECASAHILAADPHIVVYRLHCVSQVCKQISGNITN